jgi:hypothetical protein
MANLKLDLINKINQDKFYEEIELIRLAQDPNMNYKQKIEEMQVALKNLALLNTQAGLVDQYFQDAPQQQAPAPAPAPAQQPVEQKPQGKVHQGQSHGEG